MENLPDDMLYEILSYFHSKKEMALLCNISKRIQKNTLKLHFNWKLFNKDAKLHEDAGVKILDKQDNVFNNLNPTPLSLRTFKSRGIIFISH